MKVESFSQLLWLAAPLFLLAFAAGALRAASRRAADPGRRRLLQALWLALLLAVAPLWLLVAVALRLV